MMKSRLLSFCLCLLLGISSTMLFAQTRGINYQAVARDGGDNLILNTNLNVRFTVWEGGSNVYQESQFVTTNDYGLFSAIIGSTDLGSFATIDWAAGDHALQVEVDPGGGFVDLGMSALQAVPYSKIATEMKLENLSDVSGTAPANDQVLKWNGSEWVPGDGGSSAWSETGSDIYYNDGNIGIGTATPGHALHIVKSTTTANTVSIEAGMPPANRDVIEVKVDAGTADGANFMEFERGSDIVARINADGSAEFESVEFGDGSVQTSAATGPIAYGFVQSAGTTSSGSGNYTVAWVAASNRYEITITGESYFWLNYTTMVTVSSSAIHRWRVSSVSGKLLVYLHDSGGSLVQGNFQFATFK